MSPSSTWLENAKTRLLEPERLVLAEKTPYEIVGAIEDLVTVRYYPPLAEPTLTLSSGETIVVEPRRAKTPLVIVAPLAVNMTIYDLFPDRSFVRYLRARGFEPYLVDWGRPTRRHDDLGLSSYFDDFLPRVLEIVRRHSGEQRLSLHGWSFGGLLSLCYAAFGTDPELANLVLVGTPFDYHQNGELGRLYRRLGSATGWLRKQTGLRVHQASPGLFHTPGWLVGLGYKLLNPATTVQNYVELLRNMHDEAAVEAHATTGAFLDDMVAYPGRVNQDVLHYLMMNNVLPQDRLPMKASRGSFANVRANVLNIVGRSDTIVTPACSHAMQGRLGTRDFTSLTIDGGHISIVSGSASQRQSWGAIADWLLLRDG